jgi:hypothetical protein
VRKKTKKDSSDATLELLDQLLGPVEEMSEDEVNAVLSEAGIDAAAARRRLYEKVSEMRSALWEQNAPVPSQITSLLTQLRPHDLPTSDPVVAQKAAGVWVKDLLAARPIAPALAFAARGRQGDLSERDDEVRRELEKELEASLRNDSEE